MEINEIKDYMNCRYLSSQEAAWRLFSFDLHGQSHSITRLPVHLPNQQNINFNVNVPNILEALLNQSETLLTRFFHCCTMDENARNYTYVEFPEYYCYNVKLKKWSKRVRSGHFLGRMYSVHPNEGERYYLRTLLSIVKGPKSFNDLKTYNDVIYDTFQQACVARGILLL